ncbi:hypothetical protein [Caenispirillum bisanense]|uniref:Uncharacterized protein n=1 Tax=Caenispirillum bisanense TaxID=414052 RepID=A0A286G4B5_9PROT|nr:hypothetical protein [Caenispirillum bisanense]SOD89989.1 hypothetical protein SAMN05421508_101403 [Caenispirillum bisanense]
MPAFRFRPYPDTLTSKAYAAALGVVARVLGSDNRIGARLDALETAYGDLQAGLYSAELSQQDLEAAEATATAAEYHKLGVKARAHMDAAVAAHEAGFLAAKSALDDAIAAVLQRKSGDDAKVETKLRSDVAAFAKAVAAHVKSIEDETGANAKRILAAKQEHERCHAQVEAVRAGLKTYLDAWARNGLDDRFTRPAKALAADFKRDLTQVSKGHDWDIDRWVATATRTYVEGLKALCDAADKRLDAFADRRTLIGWTPHDLKDDIDTIARAKPLPIASLRPALAEFPKAVAAYDEAADEAKTAQAAVDAVRKTIPQYAKDIEITAETERRGRKLIAKEEAKVRKRQAEEQAKRILGSLTDMRADWRTCKKQLEKTPITLGKADLGPNFDTLADVVTTFAGSDPDSQDGQRGQVATAFTKTLAALDTYEKKLGDELTRLKREKSDELKQAEAAAAKVRQWLAARTKELTQLKAYVKA